MPLQVGTVLLKGHLSMPAPIGVARRASNVLHAGRPRRVVALVVLGTERLQAELAKPERGRRIKISRHEAIGLRHLAPCWFRPDHELVPRKHALCALPGDDGCG